MASGTNKIVIIILTFISSIVVVVGGYSFSSWVYEQTRPTAQPVEQLLYVGNIREQVISESCHAN